MKWLLRWLAKRCLYKALYWEALTKLFFIEYVDEKDKKRLFRARGRYKRWSGRARKLRKVARSGEG